MIHSKQFTVVLDTNVIYPLIIRDLLFWFAHYDLYTPKWSKHIFCEWKEVMIRKGVSAEESDKRTNRAMLAFPDAMVNNYEFLIAHLNLPDEKDRHVLAAAIKSGADLIVTNNLKDFPEEILDSYAIKAKTPDDFLTDIIDLNQELAIEAFREMVSNKKNPDLDEYDILGQLRNNGLKDTANFLHALM